MPLHTVLSTHGQARRGRLTTAHGTVETPAFMPVGTTSAVKALTCRDLEEAGAEIILGNTYHLYLRPGVETIASLGGLARFNSWNKPTLTDSGGFQVFSLRGLSKVSDDGVEFQSHHDGSRHLFTPEKVIEIETGLGADIIMAFDQCPPLPSSKDQIAEAVRRTTAWAKRCVAHFASTRTEQRAYQQLFLIVQGGIDPQLRTESAESLVALDAPGYAIGGLSVGESKREMEEMVGHTVPLLPSDKPRYLMGVGYPEDLLMAVGYGIDMFDCVLPTRNARTGAVFTSEGQLVYRNAEYARDDRPLDPNCACVVCRRYSRAYLRHLFNQSEITAMVLSSYHSTYFFQDLMRQIRKSIEENRFDRFRAEFLHRYRQHERVTL